jgi:D-sedoheptulose 7-phosphate isomerase
MDPERLREAIRASAQTVAALGDRVDRIADIGAVIVTCLRAGGKILTAGNGGSAAEALHMAEELVGRYRGNRPSLAALALVADPTALTCIGNDFGFDEIFARQVRGLGRRGDVLVLLSTSGRAENLARALEAGSQRGLRTVALLGRDGGALAGRADTELIVAGADTARIQEAHQVVVHLLLEIVETTFGSAP